MTRTFALCVIAIAWMSDCQPPLILSQVWADEPVTVPTIEILPAETIKLHEYEPDSMMPSDRRDFGVYLHDVQEIPLSSDFSGHISKSGPEEILCMNCNIQMDISLLYRARRPPIAQYFDQKIYGLYCFRQGMIYPLLFGELYRIEDLTRSDDRGEYALLKRVTRKELGIDAPLENSRLYIPIQSQERGDENGRLGPLSCRFWYAEEPHQYTQKLETVLKCRLDYPRVIPSEEELFPVRGPMTVAEGNILPVVDCGFKILRIVPPNVEKKVCGWVEIDPYPVSLRTPLGRELEKLEQREKLDQHKLPPQPPLAPQPEPQR